LEARKICRFRRAGRSAGTGRACQAGYRMSSPPLLVGLSGLLSPLPSFFLPPPPLEGLGLRFSSSSSFFFSMSPMVEVSLFCSS